MDPSSEAGFAFRMYGGLIVGIFGFAMAVHELLSKYGDAWSVVPLSCVGVAGVSVYFGVRKQWRRNNNDA
jgi:hypothetical protein